MKRRIGFRIGTLRGCAGLLLTAAFCIGAIVSLAHAADDPIDNSPRDNPSLVARPSDIAAGKLVQSPEGNVIGTVDDVLREPTSSRPAYIVVATDSGLTAIPYWAISHLLRDAHIVIDQSQLAAAPRIPGSERSKDGEARWGQQADSYWGAYR